MRIRIGRKCAGMAVVGLVMAGNGVANAQQAPAAEGGVTIPEVVVTAQKRSENVQNVPIAISAFDGPVLAERAVTNVSQLASVAPNVNFDSGVSFSSSTAVLAASIRGIGASDFAFNIDPAVGIYVDGVYLARSVGANADLLDVERVEILKGPQGTLFGRNTIGGAVSIVTRDPGHEFKVKGDATTGSYNLFEGRASIDIPLTANLYSMITFDIKNRDGYGKRMAFPDSRVFNSRSYTAYPASSYESSQTEGAESDRTVRGKLKYEGDRLKITLGGDYQNTSGAAPTKLLLTTQNIPGTFADLYNACIGLPTATLQAAGILNACSSSGTQYPSVRGGTSMPVARLYGLAGVNADGNPNNDVLPYGSQFITNSKDTSYATGNDFSHLTNWGVTLNGEYNLTKDILLKSITAYRKTRWISGMDGDGSPINMANFSFDQRQEQISQEVQIIGSALDQKLKYVGGAYYFRENGYLLDLVESGEGLYVIDGPNWLATENYAGFGQVDYRPNDLIGITVGGRYTQENKSFEGAQQELNGLFYKLAGNACSDTQGNIFPSNNLGGQTCRVANNYPTATNPLRLYPPGVNHETFSNFSPKVGIQIHPTEQAMIYASWSKGYKTGGWTTRYSTPQTVVSSFNPEKATTYEIGVKSTWFNRTLQVNGAIFQTDYDAIQLNYEVGSSPTIANVGNGKILGAEIEAVARPIRPLTLNMSVGYTDAYYTKLDPAVAATSGPSALQAGALVGGPLPKTPRWKVNFSPRLALPMDNGGRVIILADYTYTSSMSNNVERTYVLNRPDVSIVNLSVAYKDKSDRYTVTVGGTNITNTRYITSGSAIPAFGAITGTYNRPAEWYARVGFDF